MGRIMCQNQGANHRILGGQGNTGHGLNIPFARPLWSHPVVIIRENPLALPKKPLILRFVQMQALQTAHIIVWQSLN
ncbi:MAG: hypothetical protein ABIH24_10735 [Verrucomicrobiota bacterium]